MGDFGAKASVPGYDINHVTDFLMSFNSSWPLLKIEHSDVATITLNGTPQTIYTHNLGYPPVYFFLSGLAGSIFQEYGDLSHIGVNNTILGYDGLNPVGGTYTFRYYVCRLPLTQNFTAPIVGDSQIQTDISRDYGIKVAKPGKSTSSTDLRDFALNTSSRSLMVHKVDYGTLAFDGSDYVRTVSHGLTYTPIAFCYLKYGAGNVSYSPDYHYIIAGPQGVQDAYHSVDSSNMNIFENGVSATAPGDATMVALKDPFAKETINVSFP